MAFFENRTPEVIKRWNESTWLVMDRGIFYVCKEVLPGELDLYQKLVEVDSPFIAKVYDLTLVQDRLCAVQEYVQGETLEEYLQEKGVLSEKEVFKLIRDILEGLESMHKKGIVHRDLTPKNIIVTGDDHVKVIDFGISRVEKQGASKDTEFLGTAGFAAPEQYGFRQTSARTDIYAIGVLMNYMMTKRFPNEELAQGALRPVIEKCIRMDEADRYQDIASLRDALVKSGDLTTQDNGSSALPGFRHKVWWHKVIAVVYYFFAMLMVVVGAFIEDFGVDGHILIPIAFALMFIAPVPIIFNSGNWLDHFPMTKGKSKRIRFVWQILSLAVAWTISIALILIV